ncbi:MAG: hypothetical protein SGPRY_003969 [Prymnesium sp.]
MYAVARRRYIYRFSQQALKRNVLAMSVQMTPRGSREAPRGAAWDASSPSERLACPSAIDTSSDIFQRDELSLSVKRHLERSLDMYSLSSEKQHAAEQRRTQLLTERHERNAQRVLKYATDPSGYRSQTRAIRKSDLDELASQQQTNQANERRISQEEDRAVLQHAHMQEQMLLKRQQTRQEHLRAAADFNLRTMQERQSARQQDKAAEKLEAQAFEEHSFFDRFGSSLA